MKKREEAKLVEDVHQLRMKLNGLEGRLVSCRTCKHVVFRVDSTRVAYQVQYDNKRGDGWYDQESLYYCPACAPVYRVVRQNEAGESEFFVYTEVEGFGSTLTRVEKE